MAFEYLPGSISKYRKTTYLGNRTILMLRMWRLCRNKKALLRKASIQFDG